MNWNIVFHEFRFESGYKATVEHPAGFEPAMLTTDGTIIRLHYRPQKHAPRGMITWDIGIMNAGDLPERMVAVAAVVGTSAVAVQSGTIEGPESKKKRARNKNDRKR